MCSAFNTSSRTLGHSGFNPATVVPIDRTENNNIIYSRIVCELTKFALFNPLSRSLSAVRFFTFISFTPIPRWNSRLIGYRKFINRFIDEQLGFHPKSDKNKLDFLPNKITAKYVFSVFVLRPNVTILIFSKMI